MTRFRIGPHTEPFEFNKPVLPPDAREVDLPGRDLESGWFKWVTHTSMFGVARAELYPTYQQLIVELGLPRSECSFGTLHAALTAGGTDIAFEHVPDSDHEDDGITHQIEAWLRDGASLHPPTA